MKFPFWLVFSMIPLAMPGLAFSQGFGGGGFGGRGGDTGPTNLPASVASGAELKKVYGELSFGEGPSCDKDGNVFFTDQPNNRILKWNAADGQVSVWLTNAGHANGMNFDAKGNLLACADEKTELWSITPDGKHTVLVGQYEGKNLNGPNDVWNQPSGGIYLTDPFFARNWWNYRQRPQDSEQVYYLAPGAKELKRVTTDLSQPNGIVGVPDGKTLYVADMRGRKTYAYDTQPDGSLTNQRLICSDGSDGMTIDEQGNLYLTSGRNVRAYDKAGKALGRIPVPENTANVCFGGKDKTTLLITAGRGLYSIQMQVKGWNQSK